MASITIVDEISRVAKNMLNLIETNELPDIAIEFNNNKNLQTSVNIIAENYQTVWFYCKNHIFEFLSA